MCRYLCLHISTPAEKRQTGDIFATAYFKPNMSFLIFVIISLYVYTINCTVPVQPQHSFSIAIAILFHLDH